MTPPTPETETEALVAETLKLDAEATAGPWAVDVDYETARGAPFVHDTRGHSVILASDETALEDLELAARYRTLCPELARRLREANARIADLEAADRKEWADRPTPEDAAIQAAHPIKTGAHERWARAMRLVGDRHGKFALVALVNWLLSAETLASEFADSTRGLVPLAEVVAFLRTEPTTSSRCFLAEELERRFGTGTE